MRELVVLELQRVGIAADAVARLGEAEACLSQVRYAALVLDRGLPEGDAWPWLQRLRARRVTVPCLLLTARDALHDRVDGLEAGADDYLKKPFAVSELLARIQALLRRASAQSNPVTLTTGDLEMDLARRKVTRAGQEIELQPKEFALLEYLMRNSGRIVSKTMIMEHVWDYNFDPQTNVVEARVCRLRDKVDREFSEKRIKTIRGMGYVLE